MVKERIEEVKHDGFGEVRILIQNGHIKRILKQTEEMFNNDKSK